MMLCGFNMAAFGSLIKSAAAIVRTAAPGVAIVVPVTVSIVACEMAISSKYSDQCEHLNSTFQNLRMQTSTISICYYVEFYFNWLEYCQIQFRNPSQKHIAQRVLCLLKISQAFPTHNGHRLLEVFPHGILQKCANSDLAKMVAWSYQSGVLIIGAYCNHKSHENLSAWLTLD